MACAPRRPRRRVRHPDSGESRLGTRKGTGPTGGARLSAGKEMGGSVGLGFAGEEGGPAEEFWAAGERKKERGRWAGPKGYREKRERLLLFFSTKDSNNSIQI